jgi:hypothetical protein
MRALKWIARDVGSALGDRVFWLIMSATLIGVFAQSAWFIVPLGLLLTLFSAVSDAHWFELARERGKLLGLWLIWCGCPVQNIGFVGLAFAFGHLTRWMWL